MSFLEIVMQLGDSTLQTLLIFALTLLFSIPLGVLICAMRMYAWKPLQWIPRLYISVLRGTSLSTSYRFYAVIIAFSLNYAAYFAEIFRSGIQSIPVGQYEASRILGYGRCQMFFRIILPQTIKRILPAVTNETITLVKDTSLAFAIAYTELFTEVKQIAVAQTSMLPYLAAAIFYYVFNLLIAGIMSLVEKKLNYYKI